MQGSRRILEYVLLASPVSVTVAQSICLGAVLSGRVVGDDGQPSFTGNYGDKKSRPDHVLLSPALYKLVCVRLRCGIRVLLIMRL